MQDDLKKTELLEYGFEISNKKEKITSDSPNTLYHYTDIGGVIGIVEDNAMRATDSRFMNDRTDCIYGIMLAKKILTQKMLKDDNTNKADYYRACLAQLETETADVLSRKAFLICLSEKGNLLSQWRGYAKDTQGFSIGLKRDALDRTRRNDDAWSVILKKIDYDVESQEETILSILEKLYDKGQELNEDIEDVAHVAATALSYSSAFIKDPAYTEEAEWRIVLFSDRSKTTETDYKLKFRMRRHTLIPYINFDFLPGETPQKKQEISETEKCTLPINEIFCGPNADIETVDISLPMFLNEHGLNDVLLIKSGIPHRI